MAHPAYDRLLAALARLCLNPLEPAGSGTALGVAPSGILVSPGRPGLAPFVVSTLDRHLSAPLTLAILSVGARPGWRCRLRRLIAGAGALLAVHLAGLLTEVEFRPLLEAGYRGPTFYVDRFLWWVLSYWTLLLLPAGAAVYVYVAEWRGGGGTPAAGARLAALSAAAAVMVAGLGASLVAIRPDLPPAAAAGPTLGRVTPGLPGPGPPEVPAAVDGDAAAEAAYRRGMVHLGEGRAQEAAADLARARQARPDLPGIDRLLGDALLAAGRTREAAEAYRRAGLDDLDDPAALLRAGGALFVDGDLAAAETAFRRSLELEPGSAAAAYNLGAVALERGQEEEGIRWLRQAIRLRPGYREALNNLGVVLQHQGRWDEAVEVYAGAIRASPEDPAPHFNLGTVLVESGDPCGARSHLQRCLELPDRSGSRARCEAWLERAAAACGR